MECGCGVGNAIFPLLAAHPTLSVVGVDLSKRAIAFGKQRAAELGYGQSRFRAFVSDLAQVPLASEHGGLQMPSEQDGKLPLSARSVDISLLCFVLSAVPRALHRQFLGHIAHALKPGGVILFRDYSDGDMAQIRFAPNAKLAEDSAQYFVRFDGTLSYFFTPEELEDHAKAVGLAVEKSSVIAKGVINHKEDKHMDRKWLQVILRKGDR